MKSEEISNSFYHKLGAKQLASQVPKRRSIDLKVVQSLLTKQDTILDIGCGFGRLAIPLAKAGYNIQGIDLSPDLLKDAKRRAKKEGVKIAFKKGNMKELPYKNSSFSKLACIWSSFNHLLTQKEQVQTLNEMHRVLQKGGLAYIEMYNGELKVMQARLPGKGREKRIYEEAYEGVINSSYIHSRETLRTICNKSKFSKWKVQFKNMNGRRRLVVFLNK